MKKTASDIAEAVLFKLAMVELMEKEGYRGAGGHWSHFWGQVVDRVARADRPLIKKVLESTVKKLKNAPQQKWYRPVYKHGTKTLKGHIVGQGTYISSFLGPHQTPYGTKWG